MASLSDLRKNPVIDLAITVVVAVGIAYLVQAFIVKDRKSTRLNSSH